jgi:hypothetical protein
VEWRVEWVVGEGPVLVAVLLVTVVLVAALLVTVELTGGLGH